MKKVTFLAVSDGIFTFISVFVLSVVLLNYALPKNLSFTFAIILSVIFSIIFLKRRISKNLKSEIKKSEKKLLDQTVTELYFLSQTRLLTLFQKAFEIKNLIVERKKDYLFLPQNNTCVYINCGIEGVTKKDVVKAFNKIKDTTAEIYTTHVSTEILDFAKRFNGQIKILGAEKTFNLLKETNLIPEKTIPTLKETPRKEMIKSAFTKKKARSYFFLGLGFLFMSSLVTFKLYYLIFGTAFLLFSLTCRFFAPQEQKGN